GVAGPGGAVRGGGAQKNRGGRPRLLCSSAPRQRGPPPRAGLIGTPGGRGGGEARAPCVASKQRGRCYCAFKLPPLGSCIHHRDGFFARESFLVRSTIAPQEPPETEGPALLRAWLDRHSGDTDR